MYRYAAAIGVDIARFSLRIAVIKIEGEVLYEESYPLKQKQDRDYMLSKLTEAIQDTRQKVAGEGINPITIGISAKGFSPRIGKEEGT